MDTPALATPSAASLRWSGHWIGHQPRTATGTPADFLTGGQSDRRFSRSMFRRTLDLETVPAEAPARLTADSRYVLWVNGQEVGRGPARSQPYRQRYDSYDLAAYLSAGRNVIAVLVTYYGRPMSFWQPAPAGSNTDAALVFEAQIGDEELISDDSWRVQRSTGWSLLVGSSGGEGVPVEIVDARQIPIRWREVEFNDSDWLQASPLPAIHPASFGETRPPTYPFGRLLPREISQLDGERVAPARVVDSSTRNAPDWTTDHPVPRVTQVLLEDVVRTSTTELPASFDIADGQVQHFSVDFGRIVAGFVELDLDAPAGTVVEMHYREKVFRPELAWKGEDPETGARYVAAGADDRFAALELNGLRYIHLAVHADQPASVTLRRLEVREYLLHDGELDRVRRHLPTIERVLRWYTAYLDQRGTIADVPEWNLVDWASIFVSGRSSILTALWARALLEFAELSEAAGNSGSAQWARGLYDSAGVGFEDFWDSNRGVYLDHIIDDQRQPAASQVAQASAIISGLAPGERWGGLVDVMTDSERLVVRSWVGSETGGYDHERFAQQMRGLPPIDWDTEREMVIAEPFFSYAVHDAVARSGRAELLIDLVRRWDEFLVDGYDTFGECWGWGTPVHGWSSTPTRDLIWYILGITPAEPGYRRVRVAPRLGRLREAAGAVPTPHGYVEVRIADSEAKIDSPVPIIVVHEDGTKIELPVGQHRTTIR